MLMSSYLEVINEESFEHCIFLQNIHLDNNEILNVPDNTFGHSPNLLGVFLNANRISQLSTTAFSGTVTFLDLANNLLTNVDPAVFTSINATLDTLDLLNNRIATLDGESFADLRNLRTLILSGNAMFSLADNTFEPLADLDFLGLSNCALGSLNANWFAGLSSLHTLYLGSNNLVELPVDVFNALTGLEELHIYNNQLIELRRDSFGASLPSLTLIYGVGNNFNVIDPEVITAAANLNFLFLLNNFCVGLNFYGVSADTAFVLERIERCTTNFETAPGISCTYSDAQGLYRCDMAIHNPVGAEFASVEGQHLGSSVDADVEYVDIDHQNTRVLPSVICSQFTGLER